MGRLPGTYAVVELGSQVVDPGGRILDLRGLNFAVVMSEEEQEPQARFSTWGMVAESTNAYQANNNRGKTIIGRKGSLFYLDYDNHDDDGTSITQSIQTGPLPEPQDNLPTTSNKLIHDITWQVNTELPTSGIFITATIFDIDDPDDNFVTRTFIQTDRKVLLSGIGLQCRQFKLRLDFTSNQTYDILSLGVRGQNMNRPYTKQTR